MNTTEIDYVKGNYASKGPTFVAKHLGVSKSTIMVCAKRIGLKMSKEAKSVLLQDSHRKEDNEYPVNPSQFRVITKAEVAYILGLIWADGHLNSARNLQSIVFTTVSEDWKDTKGTFQKTGRWNEYFHKEVNFPKWKERVNIVTNNRPLFELLSSLDYRSKQNAPTKVLKIIPNHLKHYWWRGYFDGDGNLYVSGDLRQLSFASCYDQDWSFVTELLNSLDIKYSIIQRISKKGHKSSCVRITGYKKCKALCDYLYLGYSTDKIGLKRKYKTYQYLANNPCKIRRDSTPGVYFDIQKNKWKACISANKNNKLSSYLLVGFYLTEQEASMARRKKMKELNFVDRAINTNHKYHVKQEPKSPPHIQGD